MLYARIIKGQIVYENAYIKNAVFLPLEGLRIKVDVKPSKKVRSLAWNAYYWGVVIPSGAAAARLAGWDYDNDDIHGEFKKAFIPKKTKVNTETGEERIVDRTTADLSNQEFETYCRKCNQFTYEKSGEYIMMPDEFKNGKNK